MAQSKSFKSCGPSSWSSGSQSMTAQPPKLNRFKAGDNHGGATLAATILFRWNTLEHFTRTMAPHGWSALSVAGMPSGFSSECFSEPPPSAEVVASILALASRLKIGFCSSGPCGVGVGVQASELFRRWNPSSTFERSLACFMALAVALPTPPVHR